MAEKSGPQMALRVSERDNDFGGSKGVVLYQGCCCCCCLWTVTGLVGGAIGFVRGRSVAKKKHGQLPRHVRRGLLGGAVLGFVLFLLNAAWYAALSRDAGEVVFVWLAVFGAAALIPAGVFGLVGAYYCHLKGRRPEEATPEPVNRGDRRPRSTIRKGFWTGVAAGFFLFELVGLTLSLLSGDIEGFLYGWFVPLGGVMFVPMAIGGLIGAHYAQRSLSRDREGQEELAASQACASADGECSSMAPAWWAVVGMWVGGAIGVGIGIGFLVALWG